MPPSFFWRILRAYLVVHSVSYTLLILFILLAGKPIPRPIFIGIFGPIIFLLLDCAIICYYVRTVPDGGLWKKFWRAHRQGRGWIWLRRLALAPRETARLEEKERNLGQQLISDVADIIPELLPDVQPLVQQGKVREAYRLVSEVLEKLQKLEEDNQKREVELAARARELHCPRSIERLLRERRFDQAEAVLGRARALLKKAEEFGIGDELVGRLEQSADGDLEAAEELIARKEGERAFAALVGRLKVRIEGLPLPHQAPLYEKLRRLGGCPYGKREFRKALYDLEKALEEAGA